MEKYSGRCRCEKITFKVSGEPTWKVNCNCNVCFANKSFTTNVSETFSQNLFCYPFRLAGT